MVGSFSTIYLNGPEDSPASEKLRGGVMPPLAMEERRKETLGLHTNLAYFVK